MGGFASSGGVHPFANWSYHEDMLAYNWSVPVEGGGIEVMRRRERHVPFAIDNLFRPRPTPPHMQHTDDSTTTIWPTFHSNNGPFGPPFIQTMGHLSFKQWPTFHSPFIQTMGQFRMQFRYTLPW